MNKWSRWCVVFAGSALGLLCALFLFMIIVDPYNIALLATIRHVNAHEPTVHYQSRLAKAAGIIRYKPDTILLGSSVVDGGFNIPGSTAHYEPWRMDHDLINAGTPPVYNAGVRDGSLEDMDAMLRHAYANNPNLKNAIIGIEWSQVIFWGSKAAPHPIQYTPALGETHLFPYAYQKYLTWTGLDDAVRTLQDNLGLEVTGIAFPRLLPSEWTTRLHSLADVVPAATAASSVLSVFPVASTLYSKFPALVKDDLQTRIFHFSVWFALGFERRAEKGSADSLHTLETISTIRDMVAFAKEHHIHLTFYASPQPPFFWSVVRKAGVWPQYADWLRIFASIAPFYDFSALPDVYDKADVYFGDDPLHFALEFGARALPVLLSGECTLETTCVTAQTIESDLSLRAQQLDGWQKTHPYENALVDQLHFESSMTEDLNNLLPTGYEPPVNGFRVVRLLSNRYFAVPVSDKPYDVLRLLNHDYPSQAQGDSLAQVLGQIRHTEAHMGH